MVRIRVFAGAALVSAILSPAHAQVFQLPKVELEFDQQADFTAFKTFRWKDSQEPATNATVHASITWYVERGLEKKRLKKPAEGSVDLLLRYYTESKESLKGTPTQGTTDFAGSPRGTSTNVDIHKERVGTLVLEMYRASDEHLVWKAQAPRTSVDKAKLDAQIENTVRLLLAKYPPQK